MARRTACDDGMAAHREAIALLKLGADVYTPNTLGETALDVAVEGSYLHRVREKQETDERERSLFTRIFN